MKTSNRLSTLQLPALLKKPGRHRDGDGLILLVRDNGAAFWVLRYMLGGKARELGLGPLLWSTWPRHARKLGRPDGAHR